MLPEYFDLESGTIRSIFIGQNRTHTDSTELCGIGASLAVVSQIYGLTEADWERIDVTNQKDLDFRTKASDGQRFVVVEAKGRIVEDLDRLSELSGAKGDIIAKKRERRGNSARDVCLGVIAAFPMIHGRAAKCHLVDPLIEDVPANPRKYKLIARLSHYHRELNLISRAHFVIGLANRIQALTLVDEYDRFDGVALIDRNGETFLPPASLFASRSVVGSDYAPGDERTKRSSMNDGASEVWPRTCRRPASTWCGIVGKTRGSERACRDSSNRSRKPIA
jgi:hypothetical protein